MHKKTSKFFVTCFFLFSCSFAMLPLESHAADESANQFLGSWSLVSFTNQNEQGETIYPLGENAFGRISYGKNGKMMVVLMRTGREARGDEGFFAYTGNYTIDIAASTVTHHIESCIAPDWIGTDRVRKFEMLDANRIVLRPVEGAAELIWQRE